MKKSKKLNNKGFSLVELIIVVAIMAVLVVVLAPQYLRYVERSRNSTDRGNAAAIESAMMVWGSETDNALDLFPASSSGTVTVTANANAAIAGVTGNTADMEAAMTAAMGNAGLNVATIRCQSRTTFTQYVVTVTTGADGNVTVAVAES